MLRICLLAVLLPLAAPGAVVLSEIHYHPEKKKPSTEFIELYNPDATPALLDGWKLEGGVKFRFPAATRLEPEGYLVIAQDPAALEKEFKVKALGPWEKHLSNAGEKITLHDGRGQVVEEVTYGAGFPWPTAADGGGPSLELQHPAMDRKAGSSWRSAQEKPTPGVRNSVALARPPASLTSIGHAPLQPRGGEAVRVAARVLAAGPLQSVTLLYQAVAPGHYLRRSDSAYEKSWTPLPMRDDGREGDRVAGDHVYLAIVPLEVQRHRTLVRYRIVAAEAGGPATQAPVAGDSAPNFAYFVYDGAPAWAAAADPGKSPVLQFPAALMPTLPSLTLIADQGDVERSQWDGGSNKRPFPGTLIADGQVYDHILFHNRGQGSTYNTGKNKWGFKFARGHEFTPKDMWGRPFRQAWDHLSMSACASPWVTSNRGMAGLDEAVSFRTYELAGVPASRTMPTQFRVISREVEANPQNQFEGDVWGLYLVIEDPGGDFLEERGLEDGNVYRAGGGGDKKHQGRTQPTDNRDYDEFLAKSSGQQSEAWWRAHLDLPAFYSFHAVNLLVGNVDLRERENHYLYHRPDDRWTVLPWDLDMMFIPKRHQSGRVDQDRCLEIPALRMEYQNRCRELLDLLASDAHPFGGQFGQIVDEYAAAVHPAGFRAAWPELDMCRWNRHPRTSDKGGFYRNPMTGQPDNNWQRVLSTPDFAGFVRMVTDFGTPARPPETPWQRDDGDPRGYGHGFLAAEASDGEVPSRPSLQYIGSPGYPAANLRFQCSAYAGKKPFAARQWRLGALTAPGAPPRQPRSYEITPAWLSPELTAFAETIQLPATAALPGQLYRARVRVKDATGRWSRWSEPVSFTTAARR